MSIHQLLFDYDGTLHDSTAIYPPAFRQMYDQMVMDGIAPPRSWLDQEITKWLGFNAPDMWHDFMPSLSPMQTEYYGGLIGRFMTQAIEDGGARLYPHTQEVLEALRQRGYSMFLLSNCRGDYLEAHRKAFGLDRFFQGFYPAQEYGFRPKTEIFPFIQTQHPGSFVVIGDRFHDMVLAQQNQLPAIGCRYGFGSDDELSYARYKISDIQDLLLLFP